MLKDSVDRYVREVYEFENRRKWTASEEGFSRDNWKQMAELGWLGVALPEQYGGIGGILDQIYLKGHWHLLSYVVAAKGKNIVKTFFSSTLRYSTRSASLRTR